MKINYKAKDAVEFINPYPQLKATDWIVESIVSGIATITRVNVIGPEEMKVPAYWLNKKKKK